LSWAEILDQPVHFSIVVRIGPKLREREKTKSNQPNVIFSVHLEEGEGKRGREEEE
jgi:hypothetical protein